MVRGFGFSGLASRAWSADDVGIEGGKKWNDMVLYQDCSVGCCKSTRLRCRCLRAELLLGDLLSGVEV